MLSCFVYQPFVLPAITIYWRLRMSHWSMSEVIDTDANRRAAMKSMHQLQRMVGWSCMAVLVAIAIGVKGDYTHYTWWSVTEFWVAAVLAVFDQDHRVCVLFLSQSLFVIVGVSVMSWMGCTLLNDAADTFRWAYLPLNFVIHYGLFVAVFLNPPLRPITNYRLQVVAGASLFVTYSMLNDPTVIYGCNLPRGFVPTIFVVLTLCLCNDATERQAKYFLGGYRNTTLTRFRRGANSQPFF